MTCSYCGDPSKYVLHLKLCKINDDFDDKTIIDAEVDVCRKCGKEVIEEQEMKATLHYN